MSAVVAILNKQAIAIAADSAVSIGNKIFNRALKIFTLSKYKPVGIMIYSSGSFMGTPWETIIKIYRTELNQNSFSTLKGFADNFIEFLHVKHFFLDLPAQKKYFEETFLYNLYTTIYQGANENVTHAININDAINSKCDVYINYFDTKDISPEFSTYSIEDFNNDLGTEFDNSIQMVFVSSGVNLTQEVIGKIKLIAYKTLIKKETLSFYTGLVFVGFGDDEIFPALYAMNIHLAVENKLKFYETDSTVITHDFERAIHPFAQTDTMHTILSGIAPNLESICIENFTQYIEKYNQKLIALQPGNREFIDAINAIDTAAQTQDYVKELQAAKQAKYITPLMSSVSNLSKEDLAEMAESLIYLTYLQKRITFAAEDVGGAVDVAIISKGDGFIWIKRKHYFKADMNQHFIDNYL